MKTVIKFSDFGRCLVCLKNPCQCRKTKNTEEQCFCQSYYDDNNQLQDCTCGKCELKQTSKGD